MNCELRIVNYFLPLYFIKTYDMKNLVLLIICVCFFAGCEEKEQDPHAKARQRASDFAEAYFNYEFEKARKLVTPESEKWLRFAASNVTQADVDLLNGQEAPAAVSVEDCEYVNDTTTAATVKVTDFMVKDSIGQSGHIADEGLFKLILVNRGGKYYVRMEGLLRSERQSHD